MAYPECGECSASGEKQALQPLPQAETMRTTAQTLTGVASNAKDQTGSAAAASDDTGRINTDPVEGSTDVCRPQVENPTSAQTPVTQARSRLCPDDTPRLTYKA